MRAAILQAAAITGAAILLVGCYSVVMLNVGVNRNADSIAAPLDEDVFCAALAAPIIKASPADQRDAVSVREMNVCRTALEQQAKRATKVKR